MLRKSVANTVPGAPHRGRKRKALDHELQLCWGKPVAHRKELIAIHELTERLARRLSLEDGRTEFGRRVSFEEAREKPIHGWYYYKEGFSPQLLALMLKKLPDVPKTSVYLDAFAGVATSVLAAARLEPPRFRRAVGVEYNPFSHFVGNTKLRWRRLNAVRLRQLEQKITRYGSKKLPPLPDSATLKNDQIYSASRLRALRQLSAGIDHYAKPGSERDVLRLALASVLEPASFAKKDGRALRIVDPKQRATPPRALFSTAVSEIAHDVEFDGALARRRKATGSVPPKIKAYVYKADARKLPKAIKRGSVGLALYSPPYLNGIDYSEVYKVEEYFLGFVHSNVELRALREGTLRSHASIRFKERESRLEKKPTTLLVRQLIKAIAEFLDEHEERGFQHQYAELIPSYFADMYEALVER